MGADLAGGAAIVTGGASGIGRASAAGLAGAGATVVVVDRDEDAGPRVAAELGGMFVAADVADPDAWERVVAVACGAGPLRAVHLNAGVTTGEGDIAAVTVEQYRRIMGANVDGVVLGCRATVPAMERAGGGAIVVTASLAGLIAFAPDPVYTLTKHAVVGLARSLAPQLAARGITINAVCPGLVDTPLVTDDAREMLAGVDFPLIPPGDIAAAVLACVQGDDTGQAYVCQAGAPPTAFRFSGVPGPRAAGAEGRRPPGL